MNTGAPTDPPRISEREAQVHAALGEGLSNAQIARRLHISVRTVESHVSSLLRKYAVSGRGQLAALAPLAGRSPAPGLTDGVPPSVTSFVGRTRELERVLAKIRDGTRLISLHGPGGVGKSRLAARTVTVAAGFFPSGGAFVDLVPARIESVAEAVAAALGVTQQADRPLRDAILERLGDNRCLLVLDNCEHVLGPVAELIGPVLARCPATTVLATSRERLAVPGEHCIPVAPLPIATDAVRLFTDRATAVDPGFAADPTPADQEMVTAICARLEGLPLAIELAAARSAALGTAGLLAALDDSLRLLTGGRDMDKRHRSLRAVIGWSHALLDGAEQNMFQRLSVFAAAFDLAAAQAVATDADRSRTVDLLGRLVDKSLVVRSADRWRMLDAVRAFAAERLGASADASDAERRYLGWAVAAARDLEVRLSGDWRTDFDALAGDLRKALAGTATAPDGLSHALARSLAHLAFAAHFLSEAAGLYEQAAQRAPTPRQAAEDLANAADLALCATFADTGRSFSLLLTAAERARDAGDRNLRAILTARAVVMARRFRGIPLTVGASQRVDLVLAEASAAAEPASPLAAAHLAVARAWNARGRPTDPDPALSAAAVDAARATGDPILLSAALDAQGLVAAIAGRHQEAHRSSADRLKLLPELPRHEPGAAVEIVDALNIAPRHAISAGALGDALAIARLANAEDLMGDNIAMTVSLLIQPLALMGRFRDALQHADAAWQAGQLGYNTSWPSIDLLSAALACGLLGDPDGFRLWRQRAREIQRLRPASGQHSESFTAFVDARVALAAGDLDGAEALVARTFANFMNMHYVRYAHAAGAELAVVARLPAAADRLDVLAADANESDWAEAAYLRATGRLHGDLGVLRAACDAWQRIDARYERAITLLLIPDRAAEGRAELEAMGVRHSD